MFKLYIDFFIDLLLLSYTKYRKKERKYNHVM